ncbi:MAG: hypothetical protein FWC61_03275 [Proteobacteria bacterium]|nr:hypothetical protein [Pseudomonadota bacterium]
MNRKTKFFTAFLFLVCAGAAHAGVDMVIYYSSSCPYCKHARDFVQNTLVYEYPMLNVTEIEVNPPEHRALFAAAAEKCKLSGGVPMTVVNGTTCINGYGPDEESNKEFRDAVDGFLTPEEKAIVAKTRAEMAADPEKFRTMEMARALAQIKERDPAAIPADPNAGMNILADMGVPPPEPKPAPAPVPPADPNAGARVLAEMGVQVPPAAPANGSGSDENLGGRMIAWGVLALAAVVAAGFAFVKFARGKNKRNKKR